MSIPADRSRLRVEGHASTRVRSSSSSHSGVAAERLTDDLLVDILSRVPAKSLCRFKCVSNHWLSLINDPGHRKVLPQTLAGFFYNNNSEEYLTASALHFTSVSGSGCTLIDTSFAFLPDNWRVELLDCCNGLLLLSWYDASLPDDEFHYVVCNPATKERAELPDSGHEGVLVIAGRLGFDLAVSPHFHVFMFVSEEYGSTIDGVDIYSSETRRWVHKESGWERVTGIYDPESTVYLNGCLHFHAFANTPNTHSFTCLVAAVDTKGETWTYIRLPRGLSNGFIGQSQGRLHYADYKRDGDANIARLELHVLKEYDNAEWILSHNVETSSIFRAIHVAHHTYFSWIAFHPECNLIFFAVGLDMTLMCYDMDRCQVKVICALEDGMGPYLPFVPLYRELQSLHK